MILREQNTPYTYHEYAQLEEGAPYQLIRGDLIITPAPTTQHQRICKKIGYLLYEFTEKEKELGEVFYSPIDVFFSATEVYQPDVIYISKQNSHRTGEEKIEGAPDLIIEVLSPSTAYYDLRHKKMIYEKHDVKEYWIIDPIEKTIEVYVNENSTFQLYGQHVEDGIALSKILNGFEVDLKALFL